MIGATVYTFVDAATGEPTHILVDVLQRIIDQSGIPPTDCALGESLIDALKEGSLGVEEDYARTLADEALRVPLVVCEWGHTHIIADGAHRLWRRWQRGDANFLAYVVPERIWRACVVDLPGDGAFWDDFNRTAKIRT